MIVKIKDILSLIREIEKNPMNMKEMDLLGNIWNGITKPNPKISESQYNYLKSLASRKVTNENADVELTNNNGS